VHLPCQTGPGSGKQAESCSRANHNAAVEYLSLDKHTKSHECISGMLDFTFGSIVAASRDGPALPFENSSSPRHDAARVLHGSNWRDENHDEGSKSA
jgi:hypothetical protein